jgi:eight-cysteine-cluster-containing protein
MKFFIFVLGLMLILACQEEVSDDSNPNSDTNPSVQCTTDSDCATGGCSSQFCGPKDQVNSIITTCQYLPEYECLKNCGCYEGKCSFSKDEEYDSCMANLGETIALQ